jgi:microcin C transport system substrate-binding protein
MALDCTQAGALALSKAIRAMPGQKRAAAGEPKMFRNSSKTAICVIAFGLGGLSSGAVAAEEIIKSYGISTFGEMKYAADMKYLDYVNPYAPKGGEISTWSGGTFDSFNPYSTKGRAGVFSSAFFESILTNAADEIGSAYCFLCTTLEYPENKDWVIFNLREDVTFSDGSPLTAEDVVFTYDLFIEQGLPSYRAVLSQDVLNAEVLDTYRVKFTFSPDAPRRGLIESPGGLPVMSKAWFERTGARLDESRLEPAVGSGPYVLDSFDINQSITYRRNPDYWGEEHPFSIGRNNFDTIRFEYFGDSIAAFEAFKAGAYSFRNENSSKTWATGYEFPAIKDGSFAKVALPDGTMAPGQSFVFNLQREKFQDPKVREALALMFNYEWSNETLFYGLYDRINSFWENGPGEAVGVAEGAELALLESIADLLPEGVIGSEPVMAPASGARQLDRKNLRRASALLDEAGWLVGDDGMRRKNGKLLSVEFLEDSPTFDRVINPYVDNLQALGVNAILNRVDPAQATKRTREKDFDMVVDQFPMGFEPGSGLKQYFGSKGAEQSVFNSASLKSPAVDALIEVVQNAETKEALNVAIRALDRVLRAERFWVPQWYKNVHTVSYLDIYAYPDPLPPYALGTFDFWWVDPVKEAALRAAGKL